MRRCPPAATAAVLRSLPAGRVLPVLLVGILLSGAPLPVAPPLVAPAGAAPAPAPTGVRYEPPVDAPVLDPFRPPTADWAPGNRGVEYDTAPATPVGAAADGTVVFAGPVAGALHLTLEHADGVRTSYSFLGSVSVRVGQRVRRGQEVGVTGDRPLHVGARVGRVYVDPALLFSGALRLHVRLVPHPVPERDARVAALDAVRERELLAELTRGGGSLSMGGLVDAAAGFVGGVGGEPARLVWHYTGAQQVESLLVLAEAGVVLLGDEGPCTAAGVGVEPPEGRRVAVLVGGLNSSSADAAIADLDTGALGYEPADVVRFSYAGGAVPEPPSGGWADALPSAAYGPDDTRTGVPAAGVRLADLVEAAVAANPGVPLDVYAHSMGGLVLRAALAELTRRGSPLPEVVVTLGTPHDGADLATAGAALRSGPLWSVVGPALDQVDGVGAHVPALERIADLDPSDPSMRQLSETSTERDDLPPVPSTVTSLSIGARTDLVVPSPRLRGSGMRTVVVDSGIGLSAHDALPGSGGARREISLLLAGLPPTCRGRTARLADLVVGHGISDAEDGLGALVLVGSAVP